MGLSVVVQDKAVDFQDKAVDLQEFKLFFKGMFNKEGSEDNDEKVKQVSRVRSSTFCLNVWWCY